MTTIRCNAEERANFKKRYGMGGDQCEPALGTVDERLGIIVQRQGGRVAPVRAAEHERKEYLAWLAENDPTATNPFAKAGAMS